MLIVIVHNVIIIEINDVERKMATEFNEENFIKLWNEFNQKHNYNEEVLKNTLTNWGVYQEKIRGKDLFTLDCYTNLIDKCEKDGEGKYLLPEGYLCNFIERHTDCFGSSRPGNSNQYMINANALPKKNKSKDEKTAESEEVTYYVKGKNESATKNEATESFKKQILPLLKMILKAEPEVTKLKDKIKNLEEHEYQAKQILRKMLVLEYPNELIHIYKDETIDTLYKEFGLEGEKTNLEKNQDILEFIKNIKTENDNNTFPTETLADMRKLSTFLWRYAGEDAIADENSPNVILYGPPGTGKTYEVQQSLDFLCKGDTERYEYVQFHPSFTYEDFIEGIKPKGVTKDGNIKFELVNGVFKEFCIKAKNDPDNNYYFVVDEINRANLSAVFGETLSLLEKDYRHDGISDDKGLLKTQYSTLIQSMINDKEEREQKVKELAYHIDKDGNVKFGIPKNVYFIGMMNDVDKSIDAFDLALRRRFKWIRKDCNYDVIKTIRRSNEEKFENIDKYIECAETLNKYISNSGNNNLGLGKSYEFGHSFFMKIKDIAKRKEITEENLKTLFEEYLRPTLTEYLRAIFREDELEGKLKVAETKFKSKLN